MKTLLGAAMLAASLKDRMVAPQQWQKYVTTLTLNFIPRIKQVEWLVDIAENIYRGTYLGTSIVSENETIIKFMFPTKALAARFALAGKPPSTGSSAKVEPYIQ